MKSSFILYLSLLTSLNVMASSEELFTHPEELILYNPNQTNAQNLKRCALVNSDKDSCSFNESPFIGLNNESIEVEDILNRTLTSKLAYTETFKNILNQMPKEALTMFGSVNAVVISERVSPSFYSFHSGAIYLSADYFWKGTDVTPRKQKKDYRDDYGSTLNFSEHIDYYKDGKQLSKSLKPNYRSDEDLAPFIHKVLFHELAHAHDFFPKSFYSSDVIDMNKTFHETAMSRLDNGKLISYKLRLSSHLLNRTAEVIHLGSEPTEVELNMNPKYVVEDFLRDGASDLYAYTNPREDFAMLFEHNLMYYFFKQVPATIFIKYPKAKFKIPKNYKNPILGGIKNKIAQEDVQWRFGRVLEEVLDVDLSKKILQNLKETKPVVIPENTSWEAVKKL